MAAGVVGCEAVAAAGAEAVGVEAVPAGSFATGLQDEKIAIEARTSAAGREENWRIKGEKKGEARY